MKKSNMSDMQKHAKMSVLKEARDMAAKAMSGKLHGLKEAHVMAPDREGLEKGLDKAKELLHQNDGAPMGLEHLSNHMGQSKDEHPSEIDYDDHRDGAEDDLDEPSEMPENEPNGDEEVEHPMDDIHSAMPKNELEEMPHDESGEDEIEYSPDHEDMSVEQLEEQIAHLNMLKQKKMLGK